MSEMPVPQEARWHSFSVFDVEHLLAAAAYRLEALDDLDAMGDREGVIECARCARGRVAPKRKCLLHSGGASPSPESPREDTNYLLKKSTEAARTSCCLRRGAV